MSPQRFFYLMTTLVVILCLSIIGATAAGHILFKKQASKLDDLKAQSDVVEQQKVSLIQAKKDIEKYKSIDEISKTVVPQDKDQAKTVRELDKIASDSGVKLEQIIFTSSNLGQAAAPKTDASSPAPLALSQVKPVEGIKGVYSLEIILDSGKNAVPYNRFLKFLEKLEANRRTAHVSKIKVSPGETGTDVTFSLTVNAYLKP